MNIKYQKIIMFVPIVNFFLVFVWLKFISNNNLGTVYFIKIWLRILLGFIIVSLVFGSIDILVNDTKLLKIASWLEMYISSFLISFIVVKEQEKNREE